MKKIIILLMLSVASGCASNPDNLPTSYVSVATYANYDCDQLVTESNHLNHRVTTLYNSLKKKATGDAVQTGVGIILFWPALFFLEGGDGPEAAEYSRLKGEHEAIRKAAIQKKCSLDSIEDFKTPEEYQKETERNEP